MLKRYQHCYGAHVSRWTRLLVRFTWPRCMALTGLICACGQSDAERKHPSLDSHAPSRPSSTSVENEDEDKVYAVTEPFRVDPNVEQLLDLLSRPHQETRLALGPHHLSYTAQFELGPKITGKNNPKSNEQATTNKTDGTQKKNQNRVDQLELFWYGPNDRSQRFTLSQSNDSGSIREITLDGQKIYSRVDRPQWFVRNLENDLHETWLNDAQRAVYDAIELAADQLKISEVQSATDKDWGGALDIPLEWQALPRPIEGLNSTNTAAKWRADVNIDRISGQVRLQRKSGIWVRADVDVRYNFKNREGRKFYGRVSLQAYTVPIDIQKQPFLLPKSVLALPERHRYVFEQQRMLKGLARP